MLVALVKSRLETPKKRERVESKSVSDFDTRKMTTLAIRNSSAMSRARTIERRQSVARCISVAHTRTSHSNRMRLSRNVRTRCGSRNGSAPCVECALGRVRVRQSKTSRRASAAEEGVRILAEHSQREPYPLWVGFFIRVRGAGRTVADCWHGVALSLALFESLM